MADDSGFFAVGLLIYEHYRGRRDSRLYSLLTLAMGTATFQAVHKLERLGVHTHGSFDPRVVTVICIVSLGIVFAATAHQVRAAAGRPRRGPSAASPIRSICCICSSAT